MRSERGVKRERRLTKWEQEKIDQSNVIKEKRKSVGERRAIKKSREKRQKKAYYDCIREKGDNL